MSSSPPDPSTSYTSPLTIVECGRENRRLLGQVEELRRLGVQYDIATTQICVVGSQSSGKSSVVDAICKFNVPKKSVVCTRFALEISLRCAEKPGWDVEIIPSHLRTEQERRTLSEFGSMAKRQVSDPQQELGTIVNLAETVLGVAGTNGAHTFVEDVLRLKWGGPNMLDLDLVDLPGLFHGEGRGQSAEDVPVVQNLVESYMSKPSTIILAVISARDNIANQQVTSLVSKHDPDRSRTIGIITKPDDVDGPEAQQEVIELAANKTYQLRHGYHILKNRGWRDQGTSQARRDQIEADFLATAPYDQIPAGDKGIGTLGPKLMALYHTQALQSLPVIEDKIEAAVNNLRSELSLLRTEGDGGSGRERLMNIATKAVEKVTQIVSGGLTQTDFIQHDPRYQVRGRMERSLTEFADRIRLRASPYVEGSANDESPESFYDQEKSFNLLVEKTLGALPPPTIPGQFNPSLAADLCQQQTSSWYTLVEELAVALTASLEECINAVLADICDPKIAALICEAVYAPIGADLRLEYVAEANKVLPHFDKTNVWQSFATETIATAITQARSKEISRHVSRHVQYGPYLPTADPRTAPNSQIRDSTAFVRQGGTQSLQMKQLSPARTSVCEAVVCMQIHCLKEAERVIAYLDIFNVNRVLLDRFKSIFTVDRFRALPESEVDGIFGQSEEVERRKHRLQDDIDRLQSIREALRGFGSHRTSTEPRPATSHTTAHRDTDQNGRKRKHTSVESN